VYTVRITRLDVRTERLDCKLDCLELSTDPMVPVRPSSWGRLKRTYGELR